MFPEKKKIPKINFPEEKFLEKKISLKKNFPKKNLHKKISEKVGPKGSTVCSRRLQPSAGARKKPPVGGLNFLVTTYSSRRYSLQDSYKYK